MTIVLELLLAFGGALLFIPLSVLAVECFLAALPTARYGEDGTIQPRTVVLIPAHNEEAGLGRTLRSLAPLLPSWARVLVVADNCSDRTALIAREEGVEVLERCNPDQRGKGYALDFGLAHLAHNPPDVVLILDADCALSEHSVERLASRAHRLGRPIQADDVVQPATLAGVNARISAFAVLVRNRVRPRGLARLGLPCQLMGTGMAIPYTHFLHVSVAGAHLVEDMVLGLELAEKGALPLYAGDAHVVSVQPDDPKSALGQRRRWEQGHLRTLVERGPKLLGRGIATGSLGLVAMALDLLVPPLALVSLLTVSYGAVAVAGLLALGLRSGAYWAVVDGTLLFAAVGVAWILEGRSILKLRHFAQVPFYILWKIPLYVSLAFRRGQQTWVRTERTASEGPKAEPGAASERRGDAIDQR